MKTKYFRIIELPEHDVLVEKDWDNEGDNPVCDVVFHIDGVRISQKLGYDNEADRDKTFNELTNEQAQGMVDNILKLMDPK